MNDVAMNQETRSAIEDLNARFAWSLDRHEFEALRGLFTEDAHYVGVGRELWGVEAIISSFLSRTGTRVTRHGCGNLLLEQVSDHVVTGQSSWFTFADHTDPPTGVRLYMVADFTDTYERSADGTWRIGERVITPIFRDAALAPREPEVRYRTRTRAELAPDQRRLYDTMIAGPRKAEADAVPMVDGQGRLLGPFALMAIVPAVGDALQAVGAALRFGTRLDARVREAVILLVAAHHRNEFEWFAHVRKARSHGFTEEDLAAVHSGNVPPGLGPDEATALTAVRAMLTDGGLDSGQYHDAVAVLGEEIVAELTWLCGYYSMLALALNVFAPSNPLASQRVF
jgi:alkylhydroperoxidase family enzyme/3-phenylpropionate/cinnamic acid dioxygenase small subunit